MSLDVVTIPAENNDLFALHQNVIIAKCNPCLKKGRLFGVYILNSHLCSKLKSTTCTKYMTSPGSMHFKSRASRQKSTEEIVNVGNSLTFNVL